MPQQYYVIAKTDETVYAWTTNGRWILACAGLNEGLWKKWTNKMEVEEFVRTKQAEFRADSRLNTITVEAHYYHG